MSYLGQLYKTYQANLNQINQVEWKRYGEIDRYYALMPIAHTMQTAHIEVNVTENGRFHSAHVITKEKVDRSHTIVPCTESSDSRSSDISPHLLHDNLSYVSGDYVTYMHKSNMSKDRYPAYIKQLRAWTTSPGAPDKVKSIYRYLTRRSLIRDLVAEGILHLDKDGKLLKTWGRRKEDKPPIFQVTTKEQYKAFVRFNVRSTDQVKVWEDAKIQAAFIEYHNTYLLSQAKQDQGYCYITGEKTTILKKHPRGIRRVGDRTKLISSNDNEGFTFRGRFFNPNQAVSISHEVSQKAHNALKWLIQRQGKVIDDRVFLLWGNQASELPDILADSAKGLFSIEPSKASYTYKEFADRVGRAINGWKQNLSIEPMINLLVLDSANGTDQGRLAVVMYRNLPRDDYLQRLQSWHTRCFWLQKYDKISFFGAPSMQDIVSVVCGPKVEDMDKKKTRIKQLLERLLPCIIDGKPIPMDIVRSALYRASSPLSFEKTWEWEKALSVACALINQEEGLDVPLDKTITDRSYLFGRLLAIADKLERRVLGKDEQRATNAIRYMNAFRQHPERTWQIIQAALLPYQVKLGGKARFFEKQMKEVGSMFRLEEFNDQPLSGKFLLGFYSQGYDLDRYKQEEKPNESNE